MYYNESGEEVAEPDCYTCENFRHEFPWNDACNDCVNFTGKGKISSWIPKDEE